MNRKRILLAALLCLCCTVSAFAQTPPKLSPPEDNGFSSDRLSRITAFFQDAIDKKAIPGVVVIVVRDVVSGMPFDQFLRERITNPLEMRDTAFYLDAAQALRLAEMQIDPQTGQRPAYAQAENLTKAKQKWFSGGGGLLSTASDYARFCQMLMNRGQLDGIRLLSLKTVSIMASDQLPPGMPRVGGYEDLAPTPDLGQSFGLGFAVRTSLGPNPLSGSVGDYFWAGIYGSYFWIDPQEKLFAVLMIQMPFAESGYYRRSLRELVYAARIH